MKRKIKIYLVLVMTFFGGLSFTYGQESNYRSKGAHTLNFGYSPVLRSSLYKEWKPVPPLKFTLNYAYDIPMRSRVVNFYAIGEVSYIGAYDNKGFLASSTGSIIPIKVTHNRIILSAGMGLKVHLVSFLDLAVFYTGGYRYTLGSVRISDGNKLKDEIHDFSGCAGARVIGKINKINVFLGYSLTHVAPTHYNPKVEHYLDIGIGYTF